VIEAFRGRLAEFPTGAVEPQEFIEAGDAILVRNLGIATGRKSGVPIRQRFTQVWTFRDGRPILVREYLDHREALEAAHRGE
jgi:ketosteroid isomerase-like protein